MSSTKASRGLVILGTLLLCLFIMLFNWYDHSTTVYRPTTLSTINNNVVTKPPTTVGRVKPTSANSLRRRKEINNYNGPDDRIPALEEKLINDVIDNTEVLFLWFRELRDMYRYWMRNVSLTYEAFPLENWTTSWPNDAIRTFCPDSKTSSLCYRVVSEATVPPTLPHTLNLKDVTKSFCLSSCTKMNNNESLRCIAASFNHLSQCVLSIGNKSSVPPLSSGVSEDDVYIPLDMWSSDEMQGSCAKRVPLRRLRRHYTKGGTREKPSHALFLMLTTVAYIRERMLIALGSYLYPYPVLIFFNHHGDEVNERIRNFLRPLTHSPTNGSFCLDPVCAGPMGERQVLFAKEPTDQKLRGYGGAWKNVPILEHLYHNIRQAAEKPFSVYHARWFFFVDDDTYIIPWNLELILASFYVHDAYYQNVRLHMGFNHETHKKDPGFIHGGAGIMLTRETVLTIGSPKAISDCNDKCSDVPHGDFRMSCCSRRWNGTLVGTGGFYYETPYSALKTRFFKLWLWQNHVPFPLSFHRTNDTIEMHAISQFAAAHTKNKCGEPQFISWWPFRARYSAFEEGTDNRKPLARRRK